MAGLFDLPGSARILDPCFGSGVFLDSLQAKGFSRLVGIELDPALYEQASRLAKPKGPGYILGDFLRFTDKDGFDGIIMNPPYIRQEKIDSLSDFGIYKELLRRQPVFEALPSTANMYMYFVLKAITLLKDGGQMVLIFPGTWKWASVGEGFLKAIEEKCTITQWFNVRGNPFETGALVDVVILKLVRGQAKAYKEARTIVFEDGKAPFVVQKPQKEISGSGILQSFEASMTAFLEFADVRRGTTTLNNKMYMNPQKQAPELAPDFVVPILSSPKNISGYTTRNCRMDFVLRTDLDVPEKTGGVKKTGAAEKIRAAEKTGIEEKTGAAKKIEVVKARREASGIKGAPDALQMQQLRRIAAYSAYLAGFKEKIQSSGGPKTLYERILRGDEKWYRLRPVNGRGILFGYIVRNEMKFIASDTDVAVRDNFYVIDPKIDSGIMFGLLNNYYTFYQLEKQGKHYGAGVLKLQKYDIERLLLVDYRKMDEDSVQCLLSYVNLLKDRGSPEMIGEITRLLAPWAPVDFETICQAYEEAKRKRLEVNV